MCLGFVYETMCALVCMWVPVCTPDPLCAQIPCVCVPVCVPQGCVGAPVCSRVLRGRVAVHVHPGVHV